MFKGLVERQWVVRRDDGLFLVFPYGWKRKGYLVTEEMKRRYVEAQNAYMTAIMLVGVVAGPPADLASSALGLPFASYVGLVLLVILSLAGAQLIHFRHLLRHAPRATSDTKPKRIPYFEAMATYPRWFLRSSYVGSLVAGSFMAFITAILVLTGNNEPIAGGVAIVLFFAGMAYVFRRALRTRPRPAAGE